MRRWLYGWVRVRIQGLGTERFLNLCRNRGMGLWNLVLLENGIELSMYRRDCEMCGILTDKTGVSFEIIGRYGIRTLLARYRKRQAFIILGIVFLSGIWLTSLHVWDIRIENNRYYTDNQIAGCLNEYGIERGIRKRNVDCEKLEQLLRDSFERISWSAVTVEGTVLRIVVAENYGTLQAVYTETDPADLIAEESGIVESVVVRKGISQVRPGDAVEKGQILISGAVPVHDDNGEVTAYDQVHADGDVMLRSSLEYRDSIPAQWDMKNYIEDEGSSLRLGINGNYWELKGLRSLVYDIKNRICLQHDGSEAHMSDLIGTGFRWFHLPEQHLRISWYRRQRMRYEIIHLWRSESQAKSILRQNAEHFIKNLSKNEIVVVENQIRIYYDSVVYHAEGSVTVLSPQKAHQPLHSADLSLHGKQKEEEPEQQE